MSKAFDKIMEPRKCSNDSSTETATKLGLLTTLFVVAVYNFLFYNKFFPVTEGWFSVYAKYILRGAIPYRDFQLALPPLYSLKLAAFIYFFGDHFIALRIMGILLILCMTTILYLLYIKVFPVYIASFVTIIAIMYYQSGVAHITYDFIQFVTLYALLAAFFIIKNCELDALSLRPKVRVYLLFAGVFAAAAFFTKQSNGLFVIVSSLFAIFISTLNYGIWHSLKSTATFIIGALMPTSIILIWLGMNGAFSAFIQQTIFGAAKAKGTLVPILFAWIPRLLTEQNITSLIQVILLVLAFRYNNFLIDKINNREKSEYSFTLIKSRILLWIIFITSMLCILVPLANIPLSKFILSNAYFSWPFDALIIVSSVGSLLLFYLYLTKYILEQKKEYVAIFVLSTMSIGLLYGTASSAAIAEAGAFVGTGLILGYLLFIRSPYNLGKIVFFVLSCILIMFFASKKYIEPYLWWGLAQPDIRTAVEPANVDLLKGFYLSHETLQVISDVQKKIERYSSPDDSIFTFPNIPFFYILTNRYPNTFSLVHWFDVVPDELAIKEAKRILDSPPKIIISMDLPDNVWVGHEFGFRGGAPSGQRMILKAINELTSNANQYVLEAQYSIPHNYVLKVWRQVVKGTID